MRVGVGNFEIPAMEHYAKRNKYSESFHEFRHGNAPMLKYTLDSVKEAQGAVRALIYLVKHVDGDKFKIVRRKLEVYVLRCGAMEDAGLEG